MPGTETPGIVNEKELKDIYGELEEQEKAREELIKLCRELRIKSTKAISKAHAGDAEGAENFLSEAEEILKEVLRYRHYPFYRPISGEAMQEYVESVVFLSFLKRKTAPDFTDLEAPYILTGYADAVGEIRRHALDLMREGMVEKAEECLHAMEEIYSHLVQFSFPEKIVPGLRHKVDVARNLIDRTKSDLLSAKLISLLKE